MTVTITPIGVGSAEGDGLGDKARVGGLAINANEANIKAAIETLQGRHFTIQNSTLNPLVLGARYMCNNHAGITFTLPATFANSATSFSDIQTINADDASDITLTPASGDAFFVDGATHGVDTTFALTPGNKAVLSPRTTDSEWDLVVVGGGGGGGAFTADGDTEITASTAIVLADTSNDEVALTIAYTTNKTSGSNDDTGLVINQTDTASPGTSLAIETQVGGTYKFAVANDGIAYSNAGFYVNSPGTKQFGFRDQSLGILLKGSSGSALYASQLITSVRSDSSFAFSSTTDPSAAPDISLYRDAAATLAQRDSTNPQESRIYGDYASSSDYQRNSIVTTRTATTVPSAASFTLSSFIPAGAFLIGITTRVDTTCTTATGYTVGDGSDVDLWGVVSAVSAGTASGSADFTAAGASGTLYTSANDVVITSSGGNFDGTGVITVCAHYMITEAD